MDRQNHVLDPAGSRHGRTRVEQIAALLTEPFLLLGLVHLTVLGWRLPVFDRLPGWVFTTHATPFAAGWWFVLAGIPLASIGSARMLQSRTWAMLLVLVTGGTAFQHALAWSEGRGLDGMRERIVHSGHAEFAEVAVAQRSLWLVASRYEQKVQGGELGRYAHSKPPGTLLAYMATERLSRLFARDQTPAARRAALDTTAALLWPAVSYLVLIPLFAVVVRLTNRGTALLTCASYVLVPSGALMTLHTDQFLFPLLAVTTVWAAQEAVVRARARFAFGAGVLLWLAGFFTFPLLLTAAMVVAVICATRVPDTETGADLREMLRLAGAVALGTGVGLLAFRAGLGYDVMARFRDARAFNAAWKGWEGGAFQTFYFAWMNLLEFGLWIGVPLSLLAAARIRRAVRQVCADDRRGLVAPALALAAMAGYVAFFGQAKGETARLWLFFVPFASALAADELVASWADADGLATFAWLALQWATVVLTKAGQDFF